MSIRTDLAVEALDFAAEITPKGVKKTEEQKEGVTITKVDIETDEGSAVIGKPKGKYITVALTAFKNYTDNFEGEVSVIADQILSLLPQDGPVLVVGLGNEDITPDALGPFVIDYTLATRHITKEMAQTIGMENLRPVAALSPGVLGQTGIETAEIVHSICKDIHPAAVIVIDALASRSVDKIGATVQITDAGICPGSGVQNARSCLNEETLHTPVIAVGVPTVVDMTTIAYDMLGEGYSSEKVSTRGKTMMVTPREIDTIIKQAAKTVSSAINKALQPSLTLEELEGLTA